MKRIPEYIIGRICLALAAASIVGLFFATKPANAVEIFAASGPAHWSECGTSGCWRQAPEPYRFKLDTTARQIGARVGQFEVAYHDLGRASVRGTFVADADYNPHAQTVRHGATEYKGGSDQHTYGVSLQYAPRFALGAGFSVQPSVGVLAYRQRQTVFGEDCDGKITTTYDAGAHGHMTPVIGLRGLYTHGKATIGIGSEWYSRPRYVNSLAGGGSDHPVGLRTVFAEVRVAL